MIDKEYSTLQRGVEVSSETMMSTKEAHGGSFR
jgi:hypothetical protein